MIVDGRQHGALVVRPQRDLRRPIGPDPDETEVPVKPDCVDNDGRRACHPESVQHHRRVDDGREGCQVLRADACGKELAAQVVKLPGDIGHHRPACPTAGVNQLISGPGDGPTPEPDVPVPLLGRRSRGPVRTGPTDAGARGATPAHLGQPHCPHGFADVVEAAVAGLDRPRLMWVPQGTLVTVPIQAVECGEGVLADAACVMVATSLSSGLSALNDDVCAPMMPAVVRGPYLVTQASTEGGSAIVSVASVDAVEEILPTTVDQLEAACQGHSLTHLVCHGFYDWDDPLASHLQLGFDLPLSDFV